VVKIQLIKKPGREVSVGDIRYTNGIVEIGPNTYKDFRLQSALTQLGDTLELVLQPLSTTYIEYGQNGHSMDFHSMMVEKDGNKQLVCLDPYPDFTMNRPVLKDFSMYYDVR
jgi:hypothetical protein